MPRAKLFMNGRSQAVRLPKEFRFEGAEVEVRRDGDSVVLSPVHDDAWTRFLAFQKLQESRGSLMSVIRRPNGILDCGGSVLLGEFDPLVEPCANLGHLLRRQL